MLGSLFSRKGKVIKNHFGTACPRTMLLSGVTRAFIKGINYKHNNQTEMEEAARIFQGPDYNVDIVNYDSDAAINYSKYAVVFGGGTPVENLYRKNASSFPRTILYQVGSHPVVSNRASFRRLEEVFQRRGQWLGGSARLCGAGMGLESSVDGMLVLGNRVTAGPFRAFTQRPVYEVPLFFYKMLEVSDVAGARNIAEARKHFIWFAGSGLVHKGLDLVLEAFGRHPEFHLHVYGSIENEMPFVNVFRRELYEQPNIHVEGFLALQSPEFWKALQASAFVICPSCAEGCNSSVLNICGNGGNIPILTPECGIDLQDFGIPIDATTVDAVEAALLEASCLSGMEVDERIHRSAAFFQKEHSIENFRQRMKASILAILDVS